MVPPIDLKLVGKLFADTLAAIRDETPDNEALKPEAIVWLKDARYSVMRKIEASYYELERSRDAPMKRPAWADDPNSPLMIFTDAVPTLLKPFERAFQDNILKLMLACGFHNCTVLPNYFGLYISISFPAQVAAAPAEVVQTLEVEDEFSAMERNSRRRISGAFGASDFARLLVDVRADNQSGAGTQSPSKKRRGSRTVKEENDDGSSDDVGAVDAGSSRSKRRRASRAVKEESDDEPSKSKSRTRFATRASSTSTMKSPAPRRSGRKSNTIKREE
ncbi:hypothetical protein C8R43DRAFT_960191 [Mycena crocata]|nr:hypothetical protein C8R43DRAFT_960191 [Mycena crocata]